MLRRRPLIRPTWIVKMLEPVLRIRIQIRRIHMFLGLPDPHPDPLVKYMDPDPPIIKQK
jgi:hypothetical protein